MKKLEWKKQYQEARKSLRTAYSWEAHSKVWDSIAPSIRNAVSKLEMPVSIKCCMYLVKHHGRSTSDFL